MFATGQVLTVFRSRLRADGPPESLAEYGVTADLMSCLAQQMPGYVEHKAFTADDGERVTVVTFADRASQEAWRTQAEHRLAQRRGREAFYASYLLQVADVRKVHEYP